MRARVLHPGFFKSDQLCLCRPAARLLFAGLWCLADREGRLENRPGRIKLELFPADKIGVDELLAELEAVGLVRSYAVDDCAYLALPSFARWQRPHPREAPSTLPAPPTNGAIAPAVPLHGEPGNFTASPSVYGIGSPRSPEDPDVLKHVWSAWVESTGRTRCQLDGKRKGVIRARLRDYPAEDLLDAVRGWVNDPWSERPQHNEITILLRDSAHLEKFRDLWRQGPPAPPVAEVRPLRPNPIDERIRQIAPTPHLVALGSMH